MPSSCMRLKMSGVAKRFGATRALREVSFSVEAGEVHGLIGENGAGKSTLMKVLSGVCRPESGAIELDGQPFQPQSPLEARRAGIAMIHQELTLARHLTVAENILLGQEPSRFGWLQGGRRDELARNALAELQHEIPIDLPVHRLAIAEQQVVEIARALVGQPKVLILDEPTSSLTQLDTRHLFRVISRLRDLGVAIIYISHFLEECQQICDRFTILRDGKSVGTGSMAATPLSEIIRMMVGRDVGEIYPRPSRILGAPLLELREVSGPVKPRSVTFTLRAGEILGVAGLVGAGRTETARTCFGLDRLRSGTVLINGQDYGHADPHHRWQEGVGLLSENRKEEGLMLNRSVADNLTLTALRRFSAFGFVSSRKQNAAVQEWISRLGIRVRDVRQPVEELSGGNQQKVALARLLHHDAKVFLLDEPTRGIDVGSKAEIYRLMGDLAAKGRAVLFISSYLPELLGVCDTIAVMCRGRLAAIRPALEWTEQSLIKTAAGSEQG